MDFNDIYIARSQAERQLELADQTVQECTKLALGRLQSSDVPGWVLDELKKELKNYNIHTQKWKESK